MQTHGVGCNGAGPRRVGGCKVEGNLQVCVGIDHIQEPRRVDGPTPKKNGKDQLA